MTQDRVNVITDTWRTYRDAAAEFMSRPHMVFRAPPVLPTSFVMSCLPPAQAEQPLEFRIVRRHGIYIIECEGIMVEALA